MSNSTILSIQNVSKSYEGRQALNNVSFDVKEGETIALIGHSGSGKSTLLKMIFSVEDKDSGEVYFNEERLWNRSDLLVAGHEGMKYVKQDFDLHPDQTVFDNIEKEIRHLGKTHVNDRINHLAKAFGIEHVLHKKTKIISGGEQQRVAICCSLAESPELLLLDEPMAHLDQINARVANDYLWNFVKKEKITTLFVTHSPEDALAYSSKVIAMNKGQIIEVNTPHDLYFKPNSIYSAKLLGDCFELDSDLIPKEQKSNLEGTYWIRPENITLNNQGEFKCTILQTQFLGHSLRVKGLISGTEVLFFCSNNESITINKEVRVSIDFERTIFITQ